MAHSAPPRHHTADPVATGAVPRFLTEATLMSLTALGLDAIAKRLYRYERVHAPVASPRRPLPISEPENF